MAKKRVHEIAKAQGTTSKELLAALKAAGVEAKAAQPSVEESDALAGLKSSGDGASGGGTATKTKESAPKSSAKTAAASTAAKPKAESAAKPAAQAGDGASAAPAKKGPAKRRRRV